MSQAVVIRPQPGRALWTRAPLIVVAIVFAASQFYLARLGSTAMTLVGAVLVLGALFLLVWYVMFLQRARVLVSDDEVVVRDWLGRLRLRAERARVRLELVSVKDMGLVEEFAVLSTKPADQRALAVLMRRAAWGDDALSALTKVLRGRAEDELEFRAVSKRTLAREFPQVHVQNLPAIAVVVILVLLVAAVVARR